MCLRGAAGLSWCGNDGERVSSGAARGRMCVRRGLEEGWTLPSG